MKNILAFGFVLFGCLVAHAQSGGQVPAFSKADSTVKTKTQKTDSLRTAFSSKIDSLKKNVPGDSLAKANLDKANAIQTTFYNSTDSLQSAYQKPLDKIDSASSRLQHKIDSLQQLKLPTTALTKKLDSLQSLRSKQVSELNQKTDQLKAKAMKPLSEITLPPQMQEPLDKLTGPIKNFKLPDQGAKLPAIPGGKLPGLPDVKIPGSGIDKSVAGIPKLGDAKDLAKNLGNINEVTGKVSEIKQVTTQAGGYANDAKNLAKGNVDEVKNIDKTVENRVMKLEGADQLKSNSAELDKLKQAGATLKNPDSLKAKGTEMAKAQATAAVRKVAVNHFAGQEQVLQQAMDKMAKVKAKYTEVKSMADLPKHPPNPLKGKPFIERIVPGLTFQIQKSAYFLLDVNTMAMYRMYPHWSVGGGWNYRFAIKDWNVIEQPRIYGPRAAVEFKWKKGFNLRLIPELMNTQVPQSPDPSHRAWVWSTFAGIKKDFTVYKSIRGNTELLYNIYNPKNYSPYSDRIAVRFGFEFPMKKKIKKPASDPLPGAKS